MLLFLLSLRPRAPRRLQAKAPTLNEVGANLKLQVYDLDQGIYGYNSKNASYGIEVVRAEVATSPSLGLELVEMAAAADGRGLVLVGGVSGNSVGQLREGDALTLIRGATTERLTALDYDGTVANIRAACAGVDSVVIEANRLVRRADISLRYEVPGGESGSVDALAGENLRRLLLRSGLKLYDYKTKRFDQPYAQGDCQGEGICGTCLVAVTEGADSLSPMDNTEKVITRGRPASWRAACRCVVGADNVPGTIKVRLTPQSKFQDELEPGVKPIA